MSMAWLCLPAYAVLLVAYFHTAVTEDDVTPRLTFSYSKSLMTFTSGVKDLCRVSCRFQEARVQIHQATISHFSSLRRASKAPEAPAAVLLDPFA